MSATNRGAKRIESDFYPTPINIIHNLLENHPLKLGTILEPCAGNGNFAKAIRQKGYTNKIIVNELRREENLKLYNSGADIVTNHDFLDFPGEDEEITTIITNPPFSLAQEFIEKCFELYPNGEIIMLLRLAFLESKKRYNFWQQHPVSKLYILSQRPSFTGKGTDATAYAWFVWNKESNDQIKVI